MPVPIPYEISLALALEGAGAVPRAAFETALGEAKAALKEIIEAATPLELLSNLHRVDDIGAAAELAAALTRNSSDIFIVGIGGSSLGARTLAGIAMRKAPRVRFLDNPDPAGFEAALSDCDLAAARFVCISKSGGTAETLMQTLAAADALRAAGGEKYLKHHFAVVTEAKPSPLRKFAEDIGCPVLDHPPDIGGRYSVLSIVGLLPALLLGLDAGALREGARAVAVPANTGPVEGAALHAALIRERGFRETVLWSYADRLETFGAWWRQLWAESLGKGGQGTTPVAALGPADQHSQLQLFLDGPGGALFTLIETDSAGKGPEIAAEEAAKIGVPYLGGRRIGDLVAAEARATAQSLAKCGRPVRVIRLGNVDERTLGALFMHFMLETILTGRLTGVDPFGQPAVEEGKILARAYLEGKEP